MTDQGVDDPDSLEASVAYAWAPYHATDWLEANSRWERVAGLFPNYAPPYIHGGESLRKLGRLHEALEKLHLGARLFPDHPQLVTSVANCLEQMGRYKEMGEWLEKAMPRFPDNPELGVEYIRLLHGRNDYVSVLRGFQLVDVLYPDQLRSNQGVSHMVAEARLQFEMGKMDGLFIDSKDPRPLRGYDPVSEISEKELVLAFQSLGENCEFGLLQRHFQTEPLGLLRWSAISVDCLTQALAEGFEGVGAREQTKLIVGTTEYATAHIRYGMGAHTFIKIDAVKQDSIFEKLLGRLIYLRRKLIEDLEEGDQTFIYTCELGTTNENVLRIHEAVRRYGSRYLLFVSKSDEHNPPSTVRDAGDGLLLGYIARLGPDRLPEGHIWKVCHGQWMPLLRTAYEMRRRDELRIELTRSIAVAGDTVNVAR